MADKNQITTEVSAAFVGRPAIGAMVIVHGHAAKPFKASVRNYNECADDCVRVTRAHTTEEWIVSWRDLTPNG